MLKEYKVKVTEKHSDIVWVKAENPSHAKALAQDEASCDFECVYDCEILQVEEI